MESLDALTHAFVAKANTLRAPFASRGTLDDELAAAFGMIYTLHLADVTGNRTLTWLVAYGLLHPENACALERFLKIVATHQDAYGNIAHAINKHNVLLANGYPVHLFCLKLCLNLSTPGAYNYMPYMRGTFIEPDLKIMARLFAANNGKNELKTAVPTGVKQLLRVSFEDEGQQIGKEDGILGMFFERFVRCTTQRKRESLGI